MAYSISPFLIFVFISIFWSSLAKQNDLLSASTISAAPALLPDNNVSPLSSAELSPDITPLFPSPGGSESDLSPSYPSMPIIPSTESPPNPDAIAAAGPGMESGPSGWLPDSSSHRLNVKETSVVVSVFWVVFGLVHL